MKKVIETKSDDELYEYENPFAIETIGHSERVNYIMKFNKTEKQWKLSKTAYYFNVCFSRPDLVVNEFSGYLHIMGGTTQFMVSDKQLLGWRGDKEGKYHFAIRLIELIPEYYVDKIVNSWIKKLKINTWSIDVNKLISSYT